MSTRPSINGFYLGPLVVALALSVLLPAAASAQLSRQEIRCRSLAERTARAVAGKVLLVRHKCASVKAFGKISAAVDCTADTAAMAGAGAVGTGSDRFDARLERVTRKRDRLSKKCRDVSPAALGVSGLCSPASDDWSAIADCALAMGKNAADAIFALTYKDGAGVLAKEERECRQSPVKQARTAMASLLKERSKCFTKAAKKGWVRSCLATVAWPGTQSSTGDTKVDERLARAMSNLAGSVYGACAATKVNVDLLALSAQMGDPTGGKFTTHDMFNSLADLVVQHSTRILASVFSEDSHCGDGVVDAGEQCDDGNRLSCDGCDRDCSLPGCGNGSVCGPSEVCDDGGGGICVLSDGTKQSAKVCFADSDCKAGATCLSNGDECVETCQEAVCGDGFVMTGVETCDSGDANSNTGPDACRTTVATTLALVSDPLQVTSSTVFRLESAGQFGDIRAGDSVEVRLPALPATVNGVASSDIVGQRTVLASPGPGSNFIYFAPGAAFTSLGGPFGGGGGTVEVALECRLAHCGDGVTDSGEFCDDANAVEDDGCSSVCLAEACGDGVFQPWQGEQCDNGVLNSNSVADACRTDCTNPFCGDAVVDSDEQCDDGNTDNSDDCRNICVLATCGDGVVDSGVGEECDDGNSSNADSCLNSCRLATCGDGFLNAAGEECDDGNTVSGDGCSATCTAE